MTIKEIKILAKSLDVNMTYLYKRWSNALARARVQNVPIVEKEEFYILVLSNLQEIRTVKPHAKLEQYHIH